MKILCTLFLSVILFSGCSRNNDGSDNNPDCKKRVNQMDWPANANGQKTRYFYNSDSTLAKVVYYSDSVTISDADTFFYSGGKMIKSIYTFNNANFSNPYTYTDWTYNGNAPATCNVYARAGGGTYALYSSSTFEADGMSRITAINQLTGGNLQRNRFEYDANSNLTKVYIKFNSGAESLYDDYFDYDSIPNPFYKLPFETTHDIYLHSINRFSKNNHRRHVRGSVNETFVLTYEGGQVKTITDISNPAPAITTRRFLFECR